MVRMIERKFRVSDAAARRERGYVGMTSRDDGLRSYEIATALTSDRSPSFGKENPFFVPNTPQGTIWTNSALRSASSRGMKRPEVEVHASAARTA